MAIDNRHEAPRPLHGRCRYLTVSFSGQLRFKQAIIYPSHNFGGRRLAKYAKDWCTLTVEDRDIPDDADALPAETHQ